MKKLSYLLVILAALAIISIGCSSDEETSTSENQDSDKGATKVSMIYWPGPESEAMQKVVNAYNEGQGKKDNVEVEMVLLSRGGTYEKEATMMSNKSDEVDMYFTASYIIGQHTPYLEPLDDQLGDNFKNYLESSVKSLQVDGQTLAVPMDVSNHFMFYRKDLIDKLLNDSKWQAKYEEISKKVVGESLKPKKTENWNWDDYLATAAFFSQKENPDSPTKYGTALQLKNLIFNVMIWDDVLWSNGGSWLTENGKPAFTTEEAKKAVEIYKNIYENGYTSPNSSVAEFPETQAALKTGNAAFAIQWSAAYDELNDPEKSPKIAGKIGVAPIPEKNKTHVHSLAVGLNKYSKNKEASLKWLDYLSSTEAMKIYAENGGIPGIPKVLEGMGDQRAVLPIISEHIKKYGYTPPVLPETQEILEALAKDLSGAWIGEEEVDEALRNAQESVESILSK